MSPRPNPPRELADREPQRIFACATLLLLTTALLLLLTRPATPPPPDTNSATPRASAGVSRRALPARALIRASRAFLEGYLPYIYKGAPAESVKGATRTLAASLVAHRPLIPQGIHGARTRVLELRASATGPSGGSVRALVNDGGLVSYTITLRLIRRAGWLLVSELEHQ